MAEELQDQKEEKSIDISLPQQKEEKSIDISLPQQKEEKSIDISLQQQKMDMQIIHAMMELFDVGIGQLDRFNDANTDGYLKKKKHDIINSLHEFVRYRSWMERDEAKKKHHGRLVFLLLFKMFHWLQSGYDEYTNDRVGLRLMFGIDPWPNPAVDIANGWDSDDQWDPEVVPGDGMIDGIEVGPLFGRRGLRILDDTDSDWEEWQDWE